MKRIAAKFTSQYDTCLLVMGDEAKIMPDSELGAIVRSLATDDMRQTEAKNMDGSVIEIFMCVLLITNRAANVAIPPGNRRNMFIEVSGQLVQHPNYNRLIQPLLQSRFAAAVFGRWLMSHEDALLGNPRTQIPPLVNLSGIRAPYTPLKELCIKTHLSPTAAWWQDVLYHRTSIFRKCEPGEGGKGQAREPGFKDHFVASSMLLASKTVAGQLFPCTSNAHNQAMVEMKPDELADWRHWHGHMCGVLKMETEMSIASLEALGGGLSEWWPAEISIDRFILAAQETLGSSGGGGRGGSGGGGGMMGQVSGKRKRLDASVFLGELAEFLIFKPHPRAPHILLLPCLHGARAQFDAYLRFGPRLNDEPSALHAGQLSAISTWLHLLFRTRGLAGGPSRLHDHCFCCSRCSTLWMEFEVRSADEQVARPVWGQDYTESRKRNEEIEQPEPQLSPPWDADSDEECDGPADDGAGEAERGLDPCGDGSPSIRTPRPPPLEAPPDLDLAGLLSGRDRSEYSDRLRGRPTEHNPSSGHSHLSPAPSPPHSPPPPVTPPGQRWSCNNLSGEWVLEDIIIIPDTNPNPSTPCPGISNGTLTHPFFTKKVQDKDKGAALGRAPHSQGVPAGAGVPGLLRR